MGDPPSAGDPEAVEAPRVKLLPVFDAMYASGRRSSTPLECPLGGLRLERLATSTV